MCKLKKKLRVALCAFMALVLVCSLTPASANIAEAADTDNQLGTGSVGYNCEWVLNKKTDSSDPEDIAELVIRPTGPNPTLSSHILNAIPSIDNQNSVTSIVIEGKIKAQSCNSLFAGFPKVRSINTGQLDTSSVTDFSFMFANNSLLRTITHNLDTRNAVNMSSMFYGCGYLSTMSFDTSYFATASVTDMSHMFEGCKTFATLNLSSRNFDTSKVTDMSFMFSECTQLMTLKLGDKWNTKNVLNMSSMFYQCTNLLNPPLTRFNTNSVKNMSSMFAECREITTLDLSSFNTDYVRDFTSMFNGLENLVTIFASKNFVVNTNNSERMFEGCKLLVGGSGSRYNIDRINGLFARIDEPMNDPSSENEIARKAGYFTSGVNRYEYIEGADLSSGRASDVGVLFIKNQAFTGSAIKPEPVVFQGNYVLKDGVDYTLSYKNNTKAGTGTVVIEGKTTKSDLGVTYTGSLEKDFTILEPKWETVEGAPKDLQVFSSDGNYWVSTKPGETITLDSDLAQLLWQNPEIKNTITSLRIESGVKVTDCYRLFAGLSNLTELDISGLDTSDVSDFSGMFDSCANLISLDLRSLDFSNASTMANMFVNCENLSSIAFSNQTIQLMGNMASMSNMFNGCQSLKSLDLSMFDTREVLGFDRMFEGCSNLITIYTTDLFSVASAQNTGDMFLGCVSIVGGNGTHYDNNYRDGKRAVIDTSNRAGYFTGTVKTYPIDGLLSGFHYGKHFLQDGSTVSYSGGSITPTPLFDGIELTEGVDYAVSYSNNIYPGTATATVTGKGLYKGSKTISFTIMAPMASVTPRLSAAAFTYDGNAKTPSVSCTIGGHALVNGRDYTVSYKNNVNAGTATAVITGHGSYVGTINYSYRINPASINSVKFDALVSMAYNKGKAINQIPVGTYAGLAVKNGTHFTTVFKNNKKLGKATVTVTGKGNFTGTKNLTFSIVKYKQPMTVKAVAKTAKLAQLKKKAVKVTKPITVKSAKGTVTYTNVTTSGAAKSFAVNKKNGAITVTKGTKKGTYKVKVKVEAKGKGQYAYGTKTVTVKIKVS